MKSDNSRKYLLIFSAILLGYQYLGLVMDVTIPYTQIKISSQANVSIILTLIVIFFGSHYIYYWFKEKKEDRSFFEFLTSIPLALIAVVPIFYSYLKKIGINWKVISSLILIPLIGLLLAITVEFIITILFSFRTAEEMKRLGLGKVPSASKAFIRSLFLLIPLNALIIYLFAKFSYILPTPLDIYWLALFLAPTILLNSDHFINLLKCIGPPKERNKTLAKLHRRHRKAMDLHEMLYQYMGLEEHKDYEKPAIVEFASSGNLDEVKKLLDNGIDPNSQDGRGWSPLMWAAAEGHLHVVELLLEHGADPNIINYLGRSAIMYASNYGFYEIAKALIEKGAILNPLMKFNDNPPLSAAANQGHLEIVRMLVENGANVMHKDKENNKTALDIAMEAGHGDVAKYLRQIMLEMDETPPEDKTNLAKNVGWIDKINKSKDSGIQQKEETVRVRAMPNNPKDKPYDIELPKKLVNKHINEYLSAHSDKIPSKDLIQEAFKYGVEKAIELTVADKERPILKR